MAGHIDKIKTPEQLWKDFSDYVEFTQRHPFLQHGFFGKDAISDYTKKERALTWPGFRKYCGLCCGISGSTVMDYIYNKDGRYPEFKFVAELIKDSIADNQLGGALAGVFDRNIVIKLQGLVDKVELSVRPDGSSGIDLSKLTTEELKVIERIQDRLNGPDPENKST